MKKELFNGKRLKIARVYRGKSVDILAKETNINKKDILAFEDNKYKPTLENALKLSNILYFPREYFYSNENTKVVVEDVHFNPNSTIPRMEEISYREKLIMIRKLFLFFEDYIGFPELDFPNNLDKNDSMEVISQKIREHWNLWDEEKPTPLDLGDIMTAKGVIISYMNVNRKGASPFTQIQSVDLDKKYLICLGGDKNIAPIRNHDLACELGYIVSDMLNLSLKKFDCEEFAAEFLLPRQAFLNNLEDTNELESYVRLKARWAVPVSLLIYRAYSLGVISYKKYNYLLNDWQQRGWDKVEPLDDKFKLHDSSLLKLAYEALIENNIFSNRTLIDSLYDRGIILYPEDLEILMDLKPNTLKSKNNKNNVKKVDFKRKKA
ncbi:MAG: helix-turn-helix domain-containing protein [Intestinibacter sp.]